MRYFLCVLLSMILLTGCIGHAIDIQLSNEAIYSLTHPDAPTSQTLTLLNPEKPGVTYKSNKNVSLGIQIKDVNGVTKTITLTTDASPQEKMVNSVTNLWTNISGSFFGLVNGIAGKFVSMPSTADSNVQQQVAAQEQQRQLNELTTQIRVLQSKIEAQN